MSAILPPSEDRPKCSLRGCRRPVLPPLSAWDFANGHQRLCRECWGAWTTSSEYREAAASALPDCSALTTWAERFGGLVDRAARFAHAQEWSQRLAQGLCKRGHPFDRKNNRGARLCGICEHDRRAASRAKSRAARSGAVAKLPEVSP